MAAPSAPIADTKHELHFGQIDEKRSGEGLQLPKHLIDSAKPERVDGLEG